MADPTNPEWKTLDLIWDMLEADADFAAAVPSDSRIKYTNTTDRTIEPEDGLAADFPRVRVRLVGSHPWPYRTSNGSCNVLRWAIDIESGDQRMATTDANKFSDVKFAIYRALARWKTYLYDFTWDSNAYPCGVRMFKHLDTTDMVGPNERAKTPVGWTSVWLGEGELWFTTSDIVSA